MNEVKSPPVTPGANCMRHADATKSKERGLHWVCYRCHAAWAEQAQGAAYRPVGCLEKGKS